MLVAPSKTALLTKLLEAMLPPTPAPLHVEGHLGQHAGQRAGQLWGGFAAKHCAPHRIPCDDLADLLERLRRVQNASAACSSVLPPHACQGAAIGDRFDSLIVAVARALGYDSLMSYASLVCWRAGRMCAATELVDLRSPDRGSALASPEAAEAAIAHVSSTLSLRDPFRVGSEGLAAPCVVRARPWLSCDGHAPSMRLENNTFGSIGHAVGMEPFPTARAPPPRQQASKAHDVPLK